jgi:hypothetical protein
MELIVRLVPQHCRHWYTTSLIHFNLLKLVGKQEFGEICRRHALAGGKQVFDDLNSKTRKI